MSRNFQHPQANFSDTNLVTFLQKLLRNRNRFRNFKAKHFGLPLGILSKKQIGEPRFRIDIQELFHKAVANTMIQMQVRIQDALDPQTVFIQKTTAF